MSNTCTKTENSTGWRRHVQQIGALLETNFGKPFDFWISKDHVTWHSVSPDTRAANGNVREFSRELRRPEIQSITANEHRIFVPFFLRDEFDLVASTTLMTREPQLARRLADALQREYRQADELDELRRENSAFAEMAIDNFEELHFLRLVVEKLQLADLSLGIDKLSEIICPILRNSMQSESIYLILDGHGGEAEVEEGQRVIRAGRSELDDESLLWLVERFGSKNEEHPFVMNQCVYSDEFHQLPQVKSFVLTRIRRGDVAWGWMIAINKERSDLSPIDNAPRWQIEREFGTSEASLLQTTASILATHASNLGLLNEKEQLLTNIIRVLTSALEAKDPYTCGHSERVACFARRMADELGLDEESGEKLYLTGLLHDIGKIGVQDRVLRKSGRLTEEEFDLVKTHPDGGWSILQGLDHLHDILPGVLYHHERFDGNGYPDGLRGEEIPLDARILAVADAYDAMTSQRPYRDGMPHDQAKQILQQGAGSQWDPQIVHAFLAVEPDVLEIRLKHKPRTPPERLKGSTRPRTDSDPTG